MKYDVEEELQAEYERRVEAAFERARLDLEGELQGEFEERLNAAVERAWVQIGQDLEREFERRLRSSLRRARSEIEEDLHQEYERRLRPVEFDRTRPDFGQAPAGSGSPGATLSPDHGWLLRRRRTPEGMEDDYETRLRLVGLHDVADRLRHEAGDEAPREPWTRSPAEPGSDPPPPPAQSGAARRLVGLLFVAVIIGMGVIAVPMVLEGGLTIGLPFVMLQLVGFAIGGRMIISKP